MTGVTLAVLQVSIAAGLTPYSQAHQAMRETGRPMVVLVGAEWCPGCRTMKSRVLPEVARRGGLKHVVYTHVNYDKQRNLARRMLKGSTIPQLIMYYQTADGWKNIRIVGAKNADDVERFIHYGLKAATADQTASSE